MNPETLTVHLDRVSPARMSGWVIPNVPNVPQPTACVFKRGILVGKSKASIFRDDFSGEEARRNCGFRVRYPKCNVADLSLIFAEGDSCVPTQIDEPEIGLGNVLDFDRRWRSTEPSEGLTWGSILEGTSFVREAEKLAGIHQPRRVLEIGPGYGRLLKALNQIDIRFDAYVGVELSKGRVEALNAQYGMPHVAFVQGDARDVDLSGLAPFDFLISSATFEHLSPSFLSTLTNLRKYLTPKAKIAFDLIDTDIGISTTSTCKSGVFIRIYNKSEIRELIELSGLRLLGLCKFQMHSLMGAPNNGKATTLRYWLTHNRWLHIAGVRLADGKIHVHRFMVVAEAP